MSKAHYHIPFSKKRKLPYKLWKYISKEFTLPLFCAIIAFSMLFLLNSVFDDLSDFNNTKIPFSLLARYFLAKIPSSLANIVPISILLATSFMTINLGKNNELSAMRSGGLSLAVCAMPVWFFTAILAVTVFFINEKVAANCTQFTQQVRAKWHNKQTKQQQLFFYNPKGQRDWFFDSFSKTEASRNVIIRQYNDIGRTTKVLTAQTALFKKGEWFFSNGTLSQYQYDQSNLPSITDLTSFSQKQITFPETPDSIQLQHKSWELLNIREIFQILSNNLISAKKMKNHLKVLLWNRLSFPLTNFIGALLGFSLCIATGRSEIMKGFASAVFLLVLCYASGQFFLVLGKNGWLSPFLAGAASNLFFTGIALFFVWKHQ
ncbi:MAG: LptF/LptG family permease [Lentisphaeria bacterium]